MSAHRNFLAKLAQLASLVGELPEGVDVTVEWANAPPDLLLALAHQDCGSLRSVLLEPGHEVDEAEWLSGNVLVRAQRRPAPPVGRPKLTLVKP